jgi:hypothetical protein
MKPELDSRNFPMTAFAVAAGTHQLSASSFIQSQDRPKSGARPASSPYPGICISSASELLDFGFENTQLLQERED